MGASPPSDTPALSVVSLRAARSLALEAPLWPPPPAACAPERARTCRLPPAQTFRSKEISKSNVVDDMVGSNELLYNKVLLHCIYAGTAPHLRFLRQAARPPGGLRRCALPLAPRGLRSAGLRSCAASAARSPRQLSAWPEDETPVPPPHSPLEGGQAVMRAAHAHAQLAGQAGAFAACSSRAFVRIQLRLFCF